MSSESVYVPTNEDFVFAPNELTEDTEKEAVGGVKNEAVKKFMADRGSVAGMVILIILILMAVFVPVFSGHGYDEQDLDRTNLAPIIPALSSFGILDGSETLHNTGGYTVQNKYKELGITGECYPFGTDNLGRDLFSRCFMGLRVSLLIALAATAINLLIGMNYGVISGYFGGTADIIMQRIVDVIGSIPTLVIITLLLLVLKPGVGSIIIALMISG